MKNDYISESISTLKTLETFDAEVFIGNEKYSQELCNFVLTLSLIWNDAKNLMLYYEHINDVQPNNQTITKPEDTPTTPLWGETSGIKNFIEKMLIAIIHELFSLIKNSENVIKSKSFHEIIRQLHTSDRKFWEIIEQFVFDAAASNTPLGKAILMIRHKIANHYDKDELFKGYHRKFIASNNNPIISRGNSMTEQRFYFADAAAQEYCLSHQEKVSSEVFQKNFRLIIDSLNASIKNIVETFIQKRSVWRKVK